MSRAQLTEPQGQRDAAAPDAASNDGLIDGLPAPLHAQVMAIRPGDAKALAELISMFRESFAPQILAVAARTPHLGNATVQRAIKLSEHRTLPDVAPGSLGHEDRDAALEDRSNAPAHGAAVGGKPHGAEIAAGSLGASTHKGGEFDLLGSDPQLLAHSGARPTAEPAWVAGARAYNAAHAHLIDEFNELTNDVCRLDGEAKIDPQAVARWQAAHGVDADGKVGPHTVAAARKTRAQAPTVAAASAPQSDAGPPV